MLKERKGIKIDDIIKKYQTNEMEALKQSKSENMNTFDQYSQYNQISFKSDKVEINNTDQP